MPTIAITPVEGDNFGHMTPEELWDWLRNELDNAGIRVRLDLHTSPRKVYVAIHEIRGEDNVISVFSTLDGVFKWKAELAREYWVQGFHEEIPDLPDDELADEYFRRMGEAEEEWFSVTEDEVQP